MRKAATESVSPFWLRGFVISRFQEARQTPRLGLKQATGGSQHLRSWAGF